MKGYSVTLLFVIHWKFIEKHQIVAGGSVHDSKVSGFWNQSSVDGVLRRSITIYDILYMIYYDDEALISRCMYYDVPRLLLWGNLIWEIPHISGEYLLWDF